MQNAEAITDPRLVQALEEALAMLASKRHADEWSARRHSSPDHDDVDLQFHRDKLEDRSGEQIESLLAGLLFRDRHDSKKDKRQAIRTPRPATAQSKSRNPAGA
ncbi:MAG: hypothetical protein HY290_11900 [Planctomycetia bacterium]|nr:hypothetical protein [Planctomycetia bacterium]